MDAHVVNTGADALFAMSCKWLRLVCAVAALSLGMTSAGVVAAANPVPTTFPLGAKPTVDSLAKYVRIKGSNCDPAVMAEALREGVDPNADVHGDRLLSIALFYGADKCGVFLLRSGANVHFTTAVGPFLSWALQLAAGGKACDSDVVAALIKRGADPNSHMNNTSPLDMAAMTKNLDCAVSLIQSGADVNYPGTPSGETPLMLTQWRGVYDSEAQDSERRIAMTNLLLMHGADVHRAVLRGQRKGATALFFAVGLRHPFVPCAQCAVLLLKKGANPNVTDDAGRTPLLWALMPENRTNLDAMRALVRGGADVNLPDQRTGESPLMAAAALGNRQYADYLISAGAKRCAHDKSGRTAADYAKANHHPELATVLACRDIGPHP